VEECVSTVSGYASSNRIVSCRSCGLLYANPRDASLTGLYAQVVDDEYVKSWEERARTFRKHLKVLEKYRQGRKLLDIGCYAGIFLDEAKKAGYDIMGIEPSKWAAEFARGKTGAEVLHGSWDAVTLPESGFDIITIWDVIEHLEDPSACLKHVHGWLKSGGIVAITTHDIGSLFARMMGKRYPWLMRFHLYHFTPKTLSAMLSKNGLKVVLVKYYVKAFSLKYILGRLGLNVRSGIFEKVAIPLNSGDMFMIIARKE
jgi:2-polyprenyl-3-methyl-5-hydroxy-6-metoxy-1,4-benzoquinol methylase